MTVEGSLFDADRPELHLMLTRSRQAVGAKQEESLTRVRGRC